MPTLLVERSKSTAPDAIRSYGTTEIDDLTRRRKPLVAPEDISGRFAYDNIASRDYTHWIWTGNDAEGLLSLTR